MFGLAGFGGGSASRQLVLATRRQGWRGMVGRANGGMIVHLGVVLIAVAFAASASYVKSAEYTLAKGESATIAGHTITYVDTTVSTAANKRSTQAQILIDGQGPYAPALTGFAGGGSLVGTPSVRSTQFDDVMVSLLALPAQAGDPVSVRVIVQPFIIWLWIGGAVMAFGTILASIPSRLWRRPTDPVSAPLADLKGGPVEGRAGSSDATSSAGPSAAPGTVGGGADGEDADEPVRIGS